jgi:hypothetical protein
MEDEKFGGFFEGYGLVTGKDRHGDIWTKEQLIKIKRDFDDNPKKRTVFSNHDETKPIGEILSIEVEEKENGWAGLKVRGKVIKGKENEIKKIIDNGGGLSVSVLYSNCNATEEDVSNARIKMTVSPQIHREIEKSLNDSNVKFGVILRKGLDAPTTIALIGFTLTNLYFLLELLLRLKDKKENEENKSEIMEAIGEVEELIKENKMQNS